MRILSIRIFSILIIMTGFLWVFQGLDIVGGSFMSGRLRWAWIGAGAIIIGSVIFVVFSLSKKKVQ